MSAWIIDLGTLLATLTLCAPIFALVLLTLGHVALGPALEERRIQQLSSLIFGLGLGGALVLACIFAVVDEPQIVVSLGSLIALPSYHFEVALVLTPVTLTMLVLSFMLTALVGAYSARYLHRDRGFLRFYVLFVLLSLGMELIIAGRSLALLFAGWELVGLTSALLISHYSRRYGPARHGLRAYGTYRATDVGLLLAVALLEHEANAADFDHLSDLALSPELKTLVALLLVFGAMGKGAIVPFTGWLPKAMEGPTPSSAIFYGALSIHASPFLLIRTWPLLSQVPIARWSIIALGLLTALHAASVGRTRPDVKTRLGYASVAQVGLIWAEVGMGLLTVAMVHIVAHAILRTWHLLRSPSALNDHAHVGAAIQLQRSGPVARWFYVFCLEQWHLDGLAYRILLGPVYRLLSLLDGIDTAIRSRLGAADDDWGPVSSTSRGINPPASGDALPMDNSPSVDRT